MGGHSAMLGPGKAARREEALRVPPLRKLRWFDAVCFQLAIQGTLVDAQVFR